MTVVSNTPRPSSPSLPCQTSPCEMMIHYSSPGWRSEMPACGSCSDCRRPAPQINGPRSVRSRDIWSYPSPKRMLFFSHHHHLSANKSSAWCLWSQQGRHAPVIKPLRWCVYIFLCISALAPRAPGCSAFLASLPTTLAHAQRACRPWG